MLPAICCVLICHAHVSSTQIIRQPACGCCADGAFTETGLAEVGAGEAHPNTGAGSDAPPMRNAAPVPLASAACGLTSLMPAMLIGTGIVQLIGEQILLPTLMHRTTV